jgi:hypothetical protein
MREIDEQLGRCCGNFTIRVTQDGFLELEILTVTSFRRKSFLILCSPGTGLLAAQ